MTATAVVFILQHGEQIAAGLFAADVAAVLIAIRQHHRKETHQ